MIGTPMFVGKAELDALAALRELAAQHPVDMSVVMTAMKTPEGMRRHMRQTNLSRAGGSWQYSADPRTCTPPFHDRIN